MIVCDFCKRETNVAFMCDVVMETYCEVCWQIAGADCAAGKHGEGCQTTVFDDSEEVRGGTTNSG